MSERAPLLRLYLLGTPRVEHAGQPYRILRRQVRALLYYLAESQGPVSREIVAALFWPELPTGQALRQLTHLLTHLRRQLPAPDILVTTIDTLLLVPDQIWVDVSVLAALASGCPPRLCQQAIDLYRGPFLDGFSLPQTAEFESWLLSRRHRYQQSYLECLANRVERSAALGATQDAIHIAQQYLQVDDLAEGMHRRLIELFTAAGDEAAARRQHNLCKAILARELAIEPLAETTEALQTSLQATRRPQLSLPLPDRPVVGREAELDCFASRLTALQQGAGSIILLSGERGSGKSTLLHAFARRAAGAALTLTVRCLTSSLPLFGSLLGLLSDLLRGYEPQSDADLCRLAEISRLLPAIRQRFPALPAPLSDNSPALLARLQDAITHTICQVARQNQGLVLLVDEVERADEGTLAVIQALVAFVRREPLLLVVSYCCSGGEPILQIQQGIELSRYLSEIQLGRVGCGSCGPALAHGGDTGGLAGPAGFSRPTV